VAAVPGNRRGNVLISRREHSQKEPRWAAGLKGVEMWGPVGHPTSPNFQMRVFQLGQFHWPDLDLRVAGSGQYRRPGVGDDLRRQ
jgi:hypothetical protein